MEALANIFGDDKKTKKKKVYSKKLNFNLLKLPGGLNLTLAFFLFGLAAFWIAASNFLPELNRERVREAVLESTRSFELEDEISSGLFSRTNRKGDTTVSNFATMMGISILKGDVKNVKGAKDYVQRLQLGNFEDNLEQLNFGVRMLKDLGLLDSSDYASKALIDKLYSQILSFQEQGNQGSGFRTTKFRSPTVVASYYALETIETLGKLEEFKKTPEFANTIQFIIGHKSQGVAGGFTDIESQNATIVATYYATRALLYDSSNQETVREMREIAPFVFACQTVDGGFANTPEEAEEELVKSDAETTLQGLHILYSLTKVGVLDNSFLSEWSGVEAAASAYIRGCLKGGKGVKAKLGSRSVDLNANFRFIELIEEFDQFDYGTIAELKTLFLGIGIISAALAIFYFYKEQLAAEKSLPEEFLKNLTAELSTIFVLGFVGFVSMYFFPRVSILLYLALFIYIGMRLFDYISNDQTQGEFLTLAAVTTSFHFVLLVLLNSTTRGNFFTTSYVFYLFTGWFVVVTFFSGFLSTALTGNRKPSLYISAAFTGWVTSLLVTLIYVTSSDIWPVAHSLISIRGEAPIVYFVLPVVSVFLSYLAGLASISF